MKKIILPALAALLLLTTACEQEKVAPTQAPEASATAQDASVSTIPCYYPDNCVLQARAARTYLGVTPALPYGLTYWTGKQAIINTQRPRIGSVAICAENNYYQGQRVGHVALVIGITGTGSSAIIRLHEANYGGQYCRKDRSGTAAQLKIAGYFY
ncbi:hypothetical protein E5K00_13900 [Hymenobacter aquaticus]|uniref:Peptidase C51 domain-containing protein n=1 Tax=Hymenobacter aquaticus TaxID=1867101 RepID=A0A4Z0PUG0_9BACT|nr:hypothetical protein [Hymenobacter aquaticus]TGE21378.1 hypothetical protein E5K00_13900 [Hymenobacter aquaticus]